LFKNYREFMIRINDRPDGKQLQIDVDAFGKHPPPVYVDLTELPVEWSKVLELDPPPDPTDVGSSLYKLIFEKINESWGYYLATHGGKPPGWGIRISVSAETSSVRQALWELLCKPAPPPDNFVVLQPMTPVVRAARSETDCNPGPLKLPLRILVMLAAPLMQGIDPAKEKQAVADTLEEFARKSDSHEPLIKVTYIGFEADDKRNANFDTLQTELAKDPPYDIVHLICHGLFEPGQNGIVKLVDAATGRGDNVEASPLSKIFNDRKTTLVILQACQTASTDPSASYYSNVAHMLVAAGVTAVLAMQASIEQPIAREFMGKLYATWLSTHCAFEEALTQARIVLFRAWKEGKTKALSWAIPVLFIFPETQLTLEEPETPGDKRSIAPTVLQDPRTERTMDAAFPDKTRVGKVTRLPVMIRLPDWPGLREKLEAEPTLSDARPEDVRSSDGSFDVTFPRDPISGKILPTQVKVAVDADAFDVARPERDIQINVAGNSQLLSFELTARRAGKSSILVNVFDTSEVQLTSVTLATTVLAAEDAFESSYTLEGGGRPEARDSEVVPEFVIATPRDRVSLLRNAASSLNDLDKYLGTADEFFVPFEAVKGPNLASKLLAERVDFAGGPVIHRIDAAHFEAAHRPVPDVLAEAGNEYDFYWIYFPIVLEASSDWAFERLEALVEFNPYGGGTAAGRPVAYQILPAQRFATTELQEESLVVQMDERLRFDLLRPPAAGTDLPKLGPDAFPVHTNLMDPRLMTGPFIYGFSPRQIQDRGIGSPRVSWRLGQVGLSSQPSPGLLVIVRVPKATQALKVRAALQAYHSFARSSMKLRSAVEDLPRDLRTFFEEGAPVRAHRKWDLTPWLKRE
jgi:hypothetical protein